MWRKCCVTYRFVVVCYCSCALMSVVMIVLTVLCFRVGHRVVNEGRSLIGCSTLVATGLMAALAIENYGHLTHGDIEWHRRVRCPRSTRFFRLCTCGLYQSSIADLAALSRCSARLKNRTSLAPAAGWALGFYFDGFQSQRCSPSISPEHWWAPDCARWLRKELYSIRPYSFDEILGFVFPAPACQALN